MGFTAGLCLVLSLAAATAFTPTADHRLHSGTRRAPTAVYARGGRVPEAKVDAMIAATSPLVVFAELFSTLRGSQPAPELLATGVGPRWVDIAERYHLEDVPVADGGHVVYLPGFDSNIVAAHVQYPALLAAHGAVTALSLPFDCRLSLEEVSAAAAAKVEALAEASGRPVTLIGESFGGLLALDVARRVAPATLKALVLVNPATCYRRSALSTWGPVVASLPGPLYVASPRRRRHYYYH